MALSSPNRIVWLYFSSLRRVIAHIDANAPEESIKAEAAICIMLAVTVVEAFLNVYVRVAVGEAQSAAHAASVQKDITDRRSLDYKLKNWPTRVFGKALDREAPAVKAFMALKSKRNALVHFTSSHETLQLPAITIGGLTDTSVFDDLTAADGRSAHRIAEAMVAEVFRLRGIPESQIPQLLHLWTGVPAA
ncbi:MAG: hypothetical protein QOF14_5800 [Hyphomicrobiales bacterium]|jgi:hypothetical protein|nr:hypothetical protein [Hyphomicrobiales bacterium]